MMRCNTGWLRLWGLILGLGLMVTARAENGVDSYELARDRSGVKVWTQVIPGYPIRGFKAQTVVRSSLGALVGLIMDTDNIQSWGYRMKRMDILRRDDQAQTFVLRALTDFPWPLADRDVILAGSIVQDPKTLVVSIASHSIQDPAYPPYSDLVRMPDMEGLWEFKPLGKGLVEVTMVGRADPGGAIPSGVVNLVIQETPYMTLRNLRKAIADPQYQRLRLPQIKEPTQ